MGTFTTVLLITSLLYHLYRYIDHIFTPTKAALKKPAAIVNGKESTFDHLTYYYSVLKIDPAVRITHDLVEKHYYQCIQDLNDASILDQRVHKKRNEVEAARTYLIDHINYLAHVN